MNQCPACPQQQHESWRTGGPWHLLRAGRTGRPCGVGGAEVVNDGRQVARVHLHPEAVLHEECERHLLLDAVARRDGQAVAEEHAAGDVLHLQVGQVLAEADPRAGIERHEPVRVVRLEPGAVGGEPPLRPELQAILPPHRLHAPRGVDGVRHRRPRRDERAWNLSGRRGTGAGSSGTAGCPAPATPAGRSAPETGARTTPGTRPPPTPPQPTSPPPFAAAAGRTDRSDRSTR
jgi:hypothetical protein